MKGTEDLGLRMKGLRSDTKRVYSVGEGNIAIIKSQELIAGLNSLSLGEL